jgi:SAM-dependent methyltransferase
MNEFEKEYYEDPSFWANEMLQDESNMLRFHNTASMIPDDVENLLDAGCGNGVFVNYLSQHKPSLRLHAMDRSRNALQYVKTEKTEGDIVKMPFADKSFDCVTCLEVLEHLPISAFQQALDELVRVSRKYIIVSVPFNEILEDSYNRCPACRTIFNYELHMQSFSEEKFRDLFKGRNVSCKKALKDGLSISLKGHREYRKLLYKEQFLEWKSPICPVCGYHEAKKAGQPKQDIAVVSNKQRILSALTYLPKKLWPKEEKYYWIIGLFEKNVS